MGGAEKARRRFPAGTLLCLLACAACAPATAGTFPPACVSDCASPYGQVLGATPGGVRAYSNCNGRCVVFEPNRVDGTIEVGEQNYRNEPWSGGHARRIALIRRGGGFWLLDPYLLGWKHVADD